MSLSDSKARHGWQGPQGRPGPCLDFGLQFALIRDNQPKKIGVEYWALPCSNLAWRTVGQIPQNVK